jgi:hypothetical protein
MPKIFLKVGKDAQLSFKLQRCNKQQATSNKQQAASSKEEHFIGKRQVVFLLFEESTKNE